MSLIKSGILGGFSGKVGAVVGYWWRGICCMRSVAQHVRNPRTKRQMAHRRHFAATTVALRPFLGAINLGYKNVVGGTGWSEAIKYHFPLTRERVAGANDWSLDFGDIALTNGERALGVSLTASADGYVRGLWDAGAVEFSDFVDGELVVALYNETRGGGGVARVAFNGGSADVCVCGAAGDCGDVLHLYYFAVSSEVVSATCYVRI